MGAAKQRGSKEERVAQAKLAYEALSPEAKCAAEYRRMPAAQRRAHMQALAAGALITAFTQALTQVSKSKTSGSE